MDRNMYVIKILSCESMKNMNLILMDSYTLKNENLQFKFMYVFKF